MGNWGDSFVATVRACARHGTSLLRGELFAMWRCSMIISWFMPNRWLNWWRAHENQAALFQYSCDSTPATVCTRLHGKTDAWEVFRKTKVLSHFLVEKVFAWVPGGSRSYLFSEPTVIPNTKGDTHFWRFRRFVRLPVELGHKGSCVHAFVLDGGIKSVMERRIKQLVRSLAVDMLNTEGERAEFYWTCSNFFLFHLCIAHGIHNSFKSSLGDALTDASLMRAFWICVESLRNSMNVIFANFALWYFDCVDFEDWDPELCRHVWTMLGLEGKWLDLAVWLEIRFVGGRLLIAGRLRGKPSVVHLVKMLAMHMWRFRTWTTSRWKSLSKVTMALTASRMLGLPALVSYIVTKQLGSLYHIKGFYNNISDSVWRLCIVASFSAYCSDAALGCVAEDDRLPSRLPVIDGEVSRALRKTEAIGYEVWGFLTSAIGVSAVSARDASVQAAWTAATSMHSKFRAARRLPYALLPGDRIRNLEALRDGERPREDNSARMWDGMHEGLKKEPVDYLEELECIAQASWATFATEQGHIGVSGPLRHHRGRETGTITAVAQCVQASQLFGNDPKRRRLAALRRRLARLRRRNPNKYTGRQCYLKCLATEARRQRQNGRHVQPNIKDECFKRHGKRWAEMGLGKRQPYASKAAMERRTKWQQLALKQRECSRRIAALQGELEEQAVNGPFRVAACGFSEAELTQLEQAYASDRFTTEVVEDARNARRPAVDLPAAVAFGLDCMQMVEGDGVLRTRTSWDRLLAQHRDFFCKCFFRVVVDSGWVFLKMDWASQNPLICGFTEVLPCSPLSLRDGVQFMMDPSKNHFWSHWFRRCHHSRFFSDEWPFEGEMMVLTNAVNIGDEYVVSNGRWRGLTELGEFFPVVVAAAAASVEEPIEGGEEAGGGGVDLRYAECPWGWEDEEPRLPRRSASHVSPAAGEYEVDTAAVMDALAEARAELEHGDGDEEERRDFHVVVRGGAWCMEHFGVPYDSLRGQASHERAREFCRLCSLASSASFAIAVYDTDGTVAGSEVLSRAWCHKMQWWYDKYVAQGPTFDISPLVVASYPEPDSVNALLVATDNERVRARVRQLRALVPRR